MDSGSKIYVGWWGGGYHDGDMYPVREGDLKDSHLACSTIAQQRVASKRLAKKCNMCGEPLGALDRWFSPQSSYPL